MADIAKENALPTALINGLQTQYEVTGEGTPVLFIHGGFGGAESTLFPRPSVFNGLLPADRFRSITYDRRNCGSSAYSRKPYSVAQVASDARGLLDHLGIERAVIVGDSLGGQIALQFAIDQPQRVSRLLLVETGAYLVRATAQARFFQALSRLAPQRLLFKMSRERVMNPPYYQPLGERSLAADSEARARHDRYVASLPSVPREDLFRFSIGQFYNYAGFIGVDLSKRLDHLTMPVHIVHGTTDTIVPAAYGIDLHYLIRGSRLTLLEGMNHGLFYYERAREVIREIIESGAGPVDGSANADSPA